MRKELKRRLQSQPALFFIILIACTALLTLFVQAYFPALSLEQSPVTVSERSHEALSPPQAHPLPSSLAQWQNSEDQGDYFSEISPTEFGYLVWSQFPVKLFVEPLENAPDPDRAHLWIDAVIQAVQEWNAYLPLEQVDSSEAANITIWRTVPPIEGFNRSADAAEGTDQAGDTRLPRIRSAETRYELFVDRPANAPTTLSHRFTIQLSPNQTADYIKATARHELGHALGIWGHSLVETDALYFLKFAIRRQFPIEI